MVNLTLEVKGKDGTTLAANTDSEQVFLVYRQAYEEGDTIVLKSSEQNVYLMIQLEDSLNPAFVYLTEKEYTFHIPFAEKRKSYSPKSFTGEMHVMYARLATEYEINAYKNVAKNEFDQHVNSSCYPHATANVETRGESVFAARNAINGNFANDDHGFWPYESWGINQQADAAITINFGRTVEVDLIALTIRADFPHDSYWDKATLTFSDGTKQTIDMVKTHKPQLFPIETKRIEWVTLSELIQADDPSPFPALTQFEVFGREAR